MQGSANKGAAAENMQPVQQPFSKDHADCPAAANAGAETMHDCESKLRCHIQKPWQQRHVKQGPTQLAQSACPYAKPAGS